MYPFNVINWVKQVLLAGVMSVCMGVIFLGIRWRYWDRAWQKDPIFEQVTDAAAAYENNLRSLFDCISSNFNYEKNNVLRVPLKNDWH